MWPRLGVFILLLLGLWLPWAIPIYFLWGDSGPSNGVSLGLLYLLFIGLLRFWGQRVQRQGRPLPFYGLEFTATMGREMLWGYGLGLVLIGVLFGGQWGLGWVQVQVVPPGFGGILLEGVLTGLGVGFAEELFFRGWLQQELELEYQPSAAVWLQALIFAALHFIRPWDVILATWPQGLGLVLLGLSLGWAKHIWGGRLGLPMGLHGGLVSAYYWVNVGGLVVPSENIPEWLTGLGGNPLAGVVGLILLTILTLIMGRGAATAP